MQNVVDTIQFVVVNPVMAMLAKIWGYVPSIAGAIVILVVGWLLAKFIEAVFVRLLKTIKLDALSDKIGVSNIMAKGEIKLTLSEVLGAIVYWIIALVAIATALSTLNLPKAADLVTGIIDYVPSLLGAIFILIVGAVIADFVAAAVRTTTGNAGIKKAAMLSQVTKVCILIFTVLVAMEQLKIATLITQIVGILVMSLGIGLALAFGLGCKDIAGKFVQDLINDMKK